MLWSLVKNLLQKACEGDMNAFAQLFEPLRGRMRAVALRWVHADEADDVVMDAFLKAWQGLPGFNRRASLSTWLCRITRNQALDRLRRAAVRKTESMDAAPAPDRDTRYADPGQVSPAEQYDRSALQEDLDAAMKQLPPIYRRIILLRHVDGLRYAEIAAALDLPVGTVMSRLFHGRARLRALLRDWDPRGIREGVAP